jgi:tetratricopeptide (TPR) repeat protein
MRGQESFAEAREVAEAWEALIAQHPGFAPAYPQLTRLYTPDYCYSGLGATGPEERRRAYALAHKAFALDPTESHLQTVKGWSHLWAGEAALARHHLDEALRLNPYNRNRLIEASTAFMYLDDLDGAAGLLKRCRDLMPSAAAASHEEEGLLQLIRGDYEQAAALLALARHHHPDDDARTEPAIMTELYALLAAAGAKSGDLASRSRHWQERMARRWRGPGTPDRARLTQWVLFHNPFQSETRKAWLLGLLDAALSR